MAACSSGVARPAVSSITETRYCIPDHLLWLGGPPRAAAHPCHEHPRLDPTPPPPCPSRPFFYAGGERSDSDGISSRDSHSGSHGVRGGHAAADCGTYVTCFSRLHTAAAR